MTTDLKKTVLALLIASLLTALAGATAGQVFAEEGGPVAPQPTGEEIGDHHTSGDNPLATYYTFTGNGGVVVAAVGTTASSGTLTVSGIPSGSTIVKALLYTQSWEYSAISISAWFAGNSLGSAMTFSHDPGIGYATYDLNAWRFDVTPYVTGNGAYTWSFTGRSQPYGNALVVVYSNPSSPGRQIFINDGSESLYFAYSTTTFAGVQPGPATLRIYEQAGDWSDGVEKIAFNGVTVLGPGNIFNQNIGYAASLNTVSVTTVAGTNTASITTGTDWLGWHLAVLEVEAAVNQPPVANPNGPYTGNEGSPVLFNGAASSDPDGTIVSYAWTFGDGGTGAGSTPTHTYADNGVYTVTLTVTDNNGATNTGSTTATVSNVAPTVNAGPDVTNFSGQTHQLTASFTDPGTLDTHTATIDWGVGSPPEAGVVVELAGSGTVMGSHQYFVPGSYTITVTVTDKDGGVGSDSLFKTVQRLVVLIDIKPDSYPNSINLKNKGNVPVGVLSGTYSGVSFDATTIDRASLLFAGAGDMGIGKSPQDLNGDGVLDMVFHFPTQSLNLSQTSTTATLTGKTAGNIHFEGTDSVRIVPP